MKVYSLACEAGHVFEGWFGSEAEYQTQEAQGLLSCPVCGVQEIKRLPSAPRLNLGVAARPPNEKAAEATPEAALPARGEGADLACIQAAWLKGVQAVLAQTRDVGERFPEEARRMHYGETPTAPIRGQASAEEAKALREEGVEVYALPLPNLLKQRAH
jgi:hypothetical protein